MNTLLYAAILLWTVSIFVVFMMAFWYWDLRIEWTPRGEQLRRWLRRVFRQ